ncbi:Ribosomal protein L12/ ATP-dependent Clp protease adaptor protein ClpS family protein [Perilla frutescens var. frutescens]|nr:Ribosomal protein L12/ ATP-dependent Clp protease adaptor protein ClpS family protein [Perilla frutescens var. frutescens]
MKLATLYRLARGHSIPCGKTNLFQYRCFQPDFVPRDPKSKPKRYKYPAVYEPYGPRPPPSEKIVQLAEKIKSLSPEERSQITEALHIKVSHPKLERIAVEGMDDAGTQGGARGGSAKAEDKKVEKTTFDIKLEKFDAAAKLKVIKEIRSFTDLGLKEAKELVEKAPVVLKQQVTKDEANSIIEKIKAVGGVAVME